MPETETLPQQPHDLAETFRTLVSLAHGKTGAVPDELLVRHVLRITEGGDWALRRAALDAVLRRVEFAARDELRVATRPAGGRPFGLYRTRRPRSRPRPYETLLESLDPLSGSCNCADYARGSLGLCKHLLAVIDDLARRPRQWARATGAAPQKPAARRARLTWDPVRPLTGPGDWLERVRLEPAAGHAALRRHFRAARDGSLVLRDTFSNRPQRRLEIVEALHAFGAGGRARRGDGLATQPALGSLLSAEKHRLEQIVSSLQAERRLKAALRTLKRPLYPYQVEGVLRALQRGRFLLADDMGLGKTAQAIAACHALWHCGMVRRGLVIAPATLKPQWLREWQLFTDAPAWIVDGDAAARRAIYRSERAGFLIANYEQVLRDLEPMRGWKPGVVVLDEAQRIKNWATKTAACVKRIHPPYRLVLTGTPMENRIEELASLLDWVDDMALEPKWRLVPWHTTYADGASGAVGARNLQTLRERLARCLLRRVRREVLDQLTPRTDSVVPVELTPAQAQEHDALKRPIRALAEIAEHRPLTQKEFLKLMQLLTAQRIIANGLAQFQFDEQWPKLSAVRDPSPAMLRALDSPKLLELREILAQLVLDQERKVVVFSQWRRMLRLAHWAVEGMLAERGLRAAFFSGQESQRRRTANLVEFHDDPNLRVLFATDAGGVGLNLQRAANCCINLELPWNPAVLEQRIGRIYRIGQEHPIDTYSLMSRDCIEERIAALVGNKKALFDGLFDGTSDEIRFDQSRSFMAAVAKIVEAADVAEAADAGVDEEGATEELDAAEREVDRELDTSDRIDDAPAAGAALVEIKPPAPAAAPAAQGLADLFAGLRIRTGAGGGISIEAPPEAAASLAAVFEGLARALRHPAEDRPADVHGHSA